MARAAYGQGAVRYGDSSTGPHEAGWLALETAKARVTLNTAQKWSLTESVRRTMAWYCAHNAGSNARALCEAEIAAFSRTSPPLLDNLAFEAKK